MYKIKHPWGESRLSKQLLNRGCLYRSLRWLDWLLNSWHWKRCWHHRTWRVIVLFFMFLLARFLCSGWSDLSSQPANWFPTGTLVLQFYSFTYSKRSKKSMNWRPAWLPWSSLAPSQILPRSTLIKALPPHGQPGAIFVTTFSSNTASPLGTYLGELKDPPAGCGANTWITFLLDLFFEIPNLARFLSDDSKSPVPLSNLLTSPRVTQKPEKDAPTTFYREWYKAPLCGQK